MITKKGFFNGIDYLKFMKQANIVFRKHTFLHDNASIHRTKIYLINGFLITILVL